MLTGKIRRMNNALVQPGHRVCEYRLIIPLSETLQKAITQIRRKLHDKYRLSMPIDWKPSLTVLHCHAYEGTEPKLIERLQQVAIRTNSFKTELRNFGTISAHTVYVDVATRLPFQELARELKAVRSLIKIPDHDPHFVSEPQVPIAQGLKPFQFTRMWMDCEHTVFTGEFMANHLVLEKRSIANGHFEEIQVFDFLSLRHLIKQGTLFG